MANPITSVREYCNLLAKSRLLSPAEIESSFRTWRDETGGSDESVESFRKHLVSRRQLTEWQSYMILRGRADGFFIGGYKILDRIGKGQMGGGVYKAVHTLGQLVALKVLPASKAKDSHILSRFQRESRLLTQLDHPNVVRAYQVGEANGVHYIGMEYLEGETLDDVLARRKKLPWGEAVRLIHQALNGLEHLHEKRMIHRDLKPSNLMLTPAATKPDTTWNATVKILDIGLGRELFDDSTPEGQIETQLTVEGAVLGTPDYLAPEQAKDARSADIRADIYSLGCVLYHCLTGQRPFPDTNIMTQMLRHATERPTPLAVLAPDVPPGLQEVLDVMMAKSPDDRYPTPAAAAQALAPFLANRGSAPQATPLLPAYKAWLETESQMEMPNPLPPAATPAKPATTAPGPRPGTGPAPALSTAPARSAPNSSARLAAQPSPGRPTTRPAARPIVEASDEVDVELVAQPVASAPPPPPVRIVKVAEQRPLTDLDRRDWIMLTAGAAGVLLAVGLGFGLARLVRKKPEEPPPDEPAGPDTRP